MAEISELDGVVKVIAIAYDGVIVDKGHWPLTGTINKQVATAIHRARSMGYLIILWTARSDFPNRDGHRDCLKEAISLCEDAGIDFDAVNANVVSVVDILGYDPAKIVADMYVDPSIPGSLDRFLELFGDKPDDVDTDDVTGSSTESEESTFHDHAMFSIVSEVAPIVKICDVDLIGLKGTAYYYPTPGSIVSFSVNWSDRLKGKADVTLVVASSIPGEDNNNALYKEAYTVHFRKGRSKKTVTYKVSDSKGVRCTVKYKKNRETFDIAFRLVEI